MPLHRQGFTLIEVMLALALSSILVLSSWQLIKYLQAAQGRQEERTKQLLALHTAYNTMQADFNNIVARPHRPDPTGGQAALDLALPTAIYVSTASAQGLQRITYSVNADNKLIRGIQNIDDFPAGSLTESTILDDVETIAVSALNPSPTSQWPQANDPLTKLPKALQVELTTKDTKTKDAITYSWLFMVPNAN